VDITSYLLSEISFLSYNVCKSIVCGIFILRNNFIIFLHVYYEISTCFGLDCIVEMVNSLVE
jgi:hypothetical protein